MSDPVFEDYVPVDISSLPKIKGKGRRTKKGKGVWDTIKKYGEKVIKLHPYYQTYKWIEKTLAPDLKNYPNSAKKTMESLGNYAVVSCELVRTPVSSMLDKLVNYLSLGKVEEAKKKLNYDKLFHLQLVCNVKDEKNNLKKVVLQKTERVQVDGHLYGVSSLTEYLPVNIGDRKFTPNMMLEKTRKRMGDDKFFGYDAFSNNCQIFVMELLKSEGLDSQQNKDFVYQDVETIAKNIPGLSQRVVKLMTDLGNGISKILGWGEHDKLLEQIKNEYQDQLNEMEKYRKTPNKKIVMNYNDFMTEHERLTHLLDEVAKKLEEKTGGYTSSTALTKHRERMIAERKKEYAMSPEQLKEYRAEKNKEHQEYINKIIKENEDKQRKVEEWNAEMRRRKNSAFAPIVEGLTKVGDFAVKNVAPVIGVPKVVTEAYKAFAPPGSEFYKGKGNTFSRTRIHPEQQSQEEITKQQAIKKLKHMISILKAELNQYNEWLLHGNDLGITNDQVNEKIHQTRKRLVEYTKKLEQLEPMPISSKYVIVYHPDGDFSLGEKIGEGKDEYQLHAIVVNKRLSKEEATKEAEDISHKKKMFMRETKKSYRFRNIPKTKFEKKSFRTKKVNKNVSLIFGKIK